MAKANIKYFKNCGKEPEIATLLRGQGESGSSINISNYMFKTMSTVNIYEYAEEAWEYKTSSSDTANSKALYRVSAGTVLNIAGRGNKGNTIALKINLGNSKYGYLYIGEVSANGENSRGNVSYKWSSGPYGGYFGFFASAEKSIQMDSMYIPDIDKIIDAGSYVSVDLLVNNNKIDTTHIVSKKQNTAIQGPSQDVSGATLDEVMRGGGTGITATTNSESSSGSTSSSQNTIDVDYKDSIGTTEYKYSWDSSPLDDYNYNPDGATKSDNNNGILPYGELIDLFGSPYQLLPTSDCRVSEWSDNIEVAGYEFSRKIMAKMPLLYLQPGNTAFMGGINKDTKSGLLTAMLEENSTLEQMLDDYTGKLYSIVPAYKEYFNYVNPMCRAGAIFLDIGNVAFDSEDENNIGNKFTNINNASFQNMNWALRQGKEYEIIVDLDGEEETEGTPEEVKFDDDYSAYFKSYAKANESKLKSFEKKIQMKNTVSFYINSDASFQESFTNETTESSLSSVINGLSDKAREIQFLLGTASSAVGQAFDRVSMQTGISNIKTSIDNIVNGISKGNSIFSTIANSVKTIVSGGRMLFPQIWSNSSFSKSYSVNIKLVSPNPDPISWYLNCYVPMCHLMGFVCPRSEYVNSYTTPFLIRGFYRGLFNIDMGIITEMTFNRGKEGSWSSDRLPMVIDVSFTIQDLYSSMGMTSSANMYNHSMFKGYTLQNISELDYLSNLCGINFYEPDIERMAMLWSTFNITSKVTNIISDAKVGITQYINNGLIKAYNNFWF